MATNIRGNRVISGSKGFIWIDGQKWAEVKSVESKASINREDVQMAGDYGVDTKMMSITCEGSFIIHKVYSRERAFIEAFKNGQDKRFQLFVTLDDPDAYGRESVRIDNCYLTEITIAQFEAGTILEREFPFGHRIDDVNYEESIDE